MFVQIFVHICRMENRHEVVKTVRMSAKHTEDETATGPFRSQI